MRAALAAVAVMALVRVAHASDPHALFDAGNFDAAAAEYERLWQANAKPADGINAVVAWRAAGHYAHARVMLAEVKRRSPPTGKQASFVELLGERLESVTGVLAIENAATDLVVKLDGVPAELLDGQIVVDVGRRDLTVERHGCEPYHDTLLVRPTERVVVAPKLVCKQLPGSLHVEIHGVEGGLVIADGTEHEFESYDVDFPLDPGPHHVIVQRRGTIVDDEQLMIASGQTTPRKLDIPWRARNFGFLFETSQLGLASPHGVSAVTTLGAGFYGVLGGAKPANTSKPGKPAFDHHIGWHGMIFFGVDVGAGTSTLDGISGGATFWVGMHAGARLLPPLWSARHGSTAYTLDFDPLVGNFYGTGRGNALEGRRSTAFVAHAAPLTLTIETQLAHFEVAAWPLGMVFLGGDNPGNGNNSWDIGRGKSYSAALTLSAGWSLNAM